MVSLITGGSGFIGRHIAERLVRAKERVRVLDVVESPHLPGAVQFQKGSVTDINAVKAALKGVDTVFHLAATAHLWSRDKSEFDRINVSGTENVCKAAGEANVKRLIHTSSFTVYLSRRRGGTPSLVREDVYVPLKELAGAYPVSKAKAERAVLEAVENGLDAVILQPTMPIGPGDYGILSPTKMILDLINGKTPAYLETVMNLIDVRDLADAHVAAKTKGKRGERYIVGGQNMIMSDLVSRLALITGREMPKRKVPYWLALCAAHVDEFISDALTRKPPKAPLSGVRSVRNAVSFDCSKAERELGLKTGDMDETLKDLIDWFEKEGLVED